MRWTLFIHMKYTLIYDQQFAIDNGLTLTEVNCLAACFTLPIWSETTMIDGRVWYRYSEKKMCEDFPLLFGCEKRAYRNIKTLVDKGFILTSNFGKKKFLSFTENCRDWMERTKTNQQDKIGMAGQNRPTEKDEIGLQGGTKSTYKAGQNRPTEKDEIGLQDKYNNTDKDIINDKINIDKENIDTKEEEEISCGSPHAPSTEGNIPEMEIYGLTPSQIGVTKKTFDGVISKLQKVQFPWNDYEFKRNFLILSCSPKWQKKTITAIQMSLNKLSAYDLGFAKELVDRAIAGGWQGVVFKDTDEEYKKWKDKIDPASPANWDYEKLNAYIDSL